MRKFEVVSQWAIKYEQKEFKMPKRATKNSAGYDIYSPIDIVIQPNTCELIWSNMKFMCASNEFLLLCATSGMGKRNVTLANGVGIIDADYYGNESTDGNFGFRLRNYGNEPYIIKKGDKIGQAIIMNFFKTDDDIESSEVRKGGFGSTN